MIEALSSKAQMRAAVGQARREGKTVGLVPTMGALHEGHVSLVRAARDRADVVVVSIFVNPTQFGPDDDFARYPRQIEDDLRLLAAEGVAFAFSPNAEEMYGAGGLVTVDPGPLAARWEGEARAGHFAGVATVVTKLFGIVRPDVAFFGEKDFQQLAIVKRVATDLDLGVTVVGCPIVRDADGLARSSRNVYLSPEDRDRALALPAALAAATEAFSVGERNGEALGMVMRQAAISRASGAITLDYAAVVDPESLEPVATIEGEARAIVAGHVGGVRLIDNCALLPEGKGAA